MLVQIDGSHHRWLGDNGSQIALLLALGGATSAAANAVFCPEEDTLEFHPVAGPERRLGPFLSPLRRQLRRLQFSGKHRHIQRPAEATHFSRPMAELGIQSGLTQEVHMDAKHPVSLQSLCKQVEDPHEARAPPPAGGYSPDRGLCLRGLGG